MSSLVLSPPSNDRTHSGSDILQANSNEAVSGVAEAVHVGWQKGRHQLASQEIGKVRVT